MKILDIELKEAMQDMPSDILEQLEDEINRIREQIMVDKIAKASPIYGTSTQSHESISLYYRQYGRNCDYIDSDVLREAINNLRRNIGLDEYLGLDDDKEIAKIEDESERLSKERDRRPSYEGGTKHSLRTIPIQDIRSLINKVEIMRKGSTFAQKFRKMSLYQIEDFIKHDFPWDSDYKKRLQIDPEYGINTDEKYYVLRYLLAEGHAREFISRIPDDRLQELKAQFEKLRNGPYLGQYNMRESEIVTESLGSEAWQMMSHGGQSVMLVDIAEAFEKREKQSQKPAKVSLLDKLKGILFRKRALPEPVKVAKTFQSTDIRERVVPEGGKEPYQQHAKDLADNVLAGQGKSIRTGREGLGEK